MKKKGSKKQARKAAKSQASKRPPREDMNQIAFRVLKQATEGR